MKQILLAALLFTGLASFTNPEVDAKVLDAFKATFTQAQEVSWSTTGGLYEVKFVHHDIRTVVTYDHEGTITGTIRYYGEDKLPVMLRTRIKAKYAGKSIFGVTEVSTETGVTYHVILEDGKAWTNVVADSYSNMYIESRTPKA